MLDFRAYFGRSKKITKSTLGFRILGFVVISALAITPLNPLAVAYKAVGAAASSGVCEQSVASTTNVVVTELTTAGVVTGCEIKFTAGTNSWTVPYGVSSVKALVVGGGGGGNSHVGGGGGAGAVWENTSWAVSPLTHHAITVGAGGVGGYSSASQCYVTTPGDGGTSIFGSVTVLGGGRGGGWTNQPPGTGANGGGAGSGSGGQGVASTGWSGYKGGDVGPYTSQHGYAAAGGAGATENGTEIGRA